MTIPSDGVVFTTDDLSPLLDFFSLFFLFFLLISALLHPHVF